MYMFFSLAGFSTFSDAVQSCFWCRDPKLCLLGFLKMLVLALPKNLHTFISLVEVYRFGQCLGWKFLPMSIFFSPTCSRTLSDAAHARFRRGDPKLCLPRILKMLVLALFEIYTRVFHL